MEAAVEAKAPVKAKAPIEAKTPAKIKAPVVAKTKVSAPKAPVKAKPIKAVRKPFVARKITKPVKPGLTADHSIAELKEKIMATAKQTTPDYTKLIKDVQGKAKTALAKGSEVASEVTSFTKGNVEAFVSSGKILATGAKVLGKDYVTESKGAFETLTGDMKALAAVKSPTELFQLQGKLARRNFDAAIAFGSKTSESLVKLANEAFAPISNRVSIAVDKVSKAA